MRKALLVLAVVAASLALVPSSARAEPPGGGAAAIALFDNDAYVDTEGDPASGNESDNVRASLEALGHEVEPFTGITATDIAAALEGKDVLAIPEQEVANLAGDLSDEAKAVIVDFVEAGGSLLVFGDHSEGTSDTGAADLLNALFGYTLAEVAETTGNVYTKTAEAEQTEFLDGPETLLAQNGTNGLRMNSLPEEATSIYNDAFESIVTVFAIGDGSAVYLGWDWHNSDPPNEGGQDGGWQGILDAAVSQPLAAIDDVAVTEPDTGTTDVTLTVTLSFPASEVVRVDVATVDASAEQLVDYTATGGTLTFDRADVSQPFTVPVVGDNRDERNETFIVNLSNGQQADVDIDSASGTVTINDNDGIGYWLVASDGGLFNFTDNSGVAAAEAGFFGSLGNVRLNQPIVDMAATPSANGYWMVAADGGIFTFGDADFFGSTGAVRLNQPIVGMASTPTGLGYMLIASDGGVFMFGDAVFKGSLGSIRLNQPVVGGAFTGTGQGYWLVARDGGVFAFGDAVFRGSTGHLILNQPVVGMAPTPSGAGYWFVATDGGIFSFGDAQFFGSTGAVRLNQPVVDMAPTPTGQGYWLTASDGGIFSFGDAPFLGSTGAVRLNQPIVGMDAA